MSRSTAAWKRDLDRVGAGSPLGVALTEVIRLRKELEYLRYFVDRFPLLPLIVETGTTEQRAFELKQKTIEGITRILNPEGTDHE